MNDRRNLLPELLAGGWTTEHSATKNVAAFQRDAENKSLDISIHSEAFGVGKWLAEAAVTEGKTYEFTAKAVVEGADVNDIYALYTISRADGSQMIREHVEACTADGNIYHFNGKVEIPEGGCRFKVELWLKGYECSVKWSDICLTECEAVKPRMVRVALAYIAPGCIEKPTLEKNTEMITRAIDNAGATNPDIIVLSEVMGSRGVPNVTLQDVAEDENGPMCTLMRKKAREYGAYVIYDFNEVDGTEYYNTSLLFDREGKVAGKYRKTQLTVREYEMGLTPGKEMPVFETDFGKIGIMVCFDQYFSQPAELLASKGAEIVFVPSAGDAAEKLSARAMDNGIYFAVCGWNTENKNGWGPARVIAPSGEIIAQGCENTVPVVCDIDLNKKLRRGWLSVGGAATTYKGVYQYEANKKIL